MAVFFFGENSVKPGHAPGPLTNKPTVLLLVVVEEAEGDVMGAFEPVGETADVVLVAGGDKILALLQAASTALTPPAANKVRNLRRVRPKFRALPHKLSVSGVLTLATPSLLNLLVTKP